MQTTTTMQTTQQSEIQNRSAERSRSTKSKIFMTPTELTKLAFQSAAPQYFSILADMAEVAKEGRYQRDYADLKPAAADMLLEKGFDVERRADKNNCWTIGFGEQEDLRALIKEVEREQAPEFAA